MSRWRRDAMILLVVSVGFALLAAALLVIGRAAGGGWSALDYLVYAIGVGVLWTLVTTGYLVWVVVRDGWQLSSAPAALILAALVSAGAVWGYREQVAEADCQAAIGFYQNLAALPAAERSAAIATAGGFVRTPSDCAIDGFQLAFGRTALLPDSAAPIADAERAAVLAHLLDAGLPPSYRLLYGLAVDDADAAGSRLVLQQRRQLNTATGAGWVLFPDDIVGALLSRARPSTAEPSLDARYRAVLKVFVDEGVPDPSALPLGTREQLAELGLLSRR